MTTAFALGALGALSLLLGVIAARIRRPPSVLLGVPMAFGSGALLAAVTILVAGPVMRRGPTWALGAGLVVGGLLFLLLERSVNARGGFLRKAATTIAYVRRQERERLQRVLRSLGRLDVFEGQPNHVLGDLAEALVPVAKAAGATIYRRGDPCHDMCILAEGEVDLIPRDESEEPTRVQAHSAFGHLAFLAGTRHSVTAVARTPVRYWKLPRAEFDQAVRNSASLSRGYERTLQSPRIKAYLETTQGMDREAREEWIDGLNRAVHERAEFPTATDAPPEGGGDVEVMLRRFPDLADLPDDELKLLAERVFVKVHQPGHTFFQRGDVADRIYLLDAGEITIVAGSAKSGRTGEFHPGQIIGVYSFLAGGHHTATAAAATDVRVGVLRKSDLEAVLPRCPRLNEMIESWLRRTQLNHYLRRRQGLPREHATTWIGHALRNLRAGRVLPSIESLMAGVARPTGAPVAIGLGVLLDNLPESILIGVCLVHASPVSVAALVAGVFLANFPEALSSSVGMLEHGVRFGRVLGMWAAVVLCAGIGAALGNVLLAGAPDWALTGVQGLLAGAVVTMIAETMLPEAYTRSGPLTGLAALGGFVTTMLISALTGGL